MQDTRCACLPWERKARHCLQPPSPIFLLVALFMTPSPRCAQVVPYSSPVRSLDEVETIKEVEVLSDEQPQQPRKPQVIAWKSGPEHEAGSGAAVASGGAWRKLKTAQRVTHGSRLRRVFPSRFADFKYQSQGTLITSSRRTPSIKPPAPRRDAPFEKLRALCARRKYKLPIYPKSAAQLNRLEKATEDVALFSGASSGSGQFSIGAYELGLKQALFLSMESRACVVDEYILRQGERGDKFYIVETGEYEVTLRQKNDAVVHRYVQEGSFGELALLYQLPRASSVRCTVAGKLWSLDRATFRRAFVSHGHPDPTLRFLKTVRKVHDALDEATKHGMKAASSASHALMAAPGAIVPSQLDGILAHIMPPGVSTAEIEELTKRCRSHLDAGTEAVSLEEIATALVAAGADGSDESKKLLRTRDLVFRAWHDVWARRTRRRDPSPQLAPPLTSRARVSGVNRARRDLRCCF